MNATTGNGLPLLRRYRRRKTARVFGFNPWNFEAEAGDLMVDSTTGRLYRCEESSGPDKAAIGELNPREIKPPLPGLHAVIHENEIWWASAQKPQPRRRYFRGVSVRLECEHRTVLSSSMYRLDRRRLACLKGHAERGGTFCEKCGTKCMPVKWGTTVRLSEAKRR